MTAVEDVEAGRAEQFRRHYVEHRLTHQLTWYRNRRAEYERAHRQAVFVRNALLGLAAAGGMGAQFVAPDIRGYLGVAAALCAALAGAVTAYESLIGFAAVSKLYGDAVSNLETVRDEWEAPGSDTDIDRAEQIFRSENGQWGQLVVQGRPEQTVESERHPIP